MSKLYQFQCLSLLVLFLYNTSMTSAKGKGKTYDVQIERTELYELNPKYITNFSLYTRRISRRAPYSVTVKFTLVYPATNNVTMLITFYEKVNSEYKPTPLVIKLGFCDWMKKDKLVHPIMTRFSLNDITCPLKGRVEIVDAVIKSEDAPTGFWPFEKNRLNFHLFSTATKEVLVNCGLYMSTVERPERKNITKKG